MVERKPFTTIAAFIFAIMAIVHLYRLFTHFQLVLGSHAIPEWMSMVALILTAGLSIMLFRESGR